MQEMSVRKCPSNNAVAFLDLHPPFHFRLTVADDALVDRHGFTTKPNLPFELSFVVQYVKSVARLDRIRNFTISPHRKRRGYHLASQPLNGLCLVFGANHARAIGPIKKAN